ncbi:MAG TPA: hypothetical protein VIH40_08750 [Xanthobacteraceae bacterium]
MRVLLAFILGIGVTIGGAYVHDASIDISAKRLVNWDVASELARLTVDRARYEWDRLTSR